LNWARRFPALRSVLVFESSAKQNLNEYSELENDFYLFNKKEITSGHGVESLWLLSFEKRQ